VGPFAEVPYEMLKERLLRFQTEWWQKHGRKVTPEDMATGLVPGEVICMYNEIGKRLTPEQQAQDVEQKAAREARAAARKAEDEARQAAAAEKRAEDEARLDAAAETREEEWAAFEANKEDEWTSAKAAAKDQRVEAAGGSAIGAHVLSGAASFVKPAEMATKTGPTWEEYVQQARDDFGLRDDDDDEASAQQAEALRWARDGGAAADELAQREAWQKQQLAVGA
jgi:hypothetical protein